VVGGETLLDLAYQEDSRADVDMNVVATGAGRFVEVQATGEQGTFGGDELSALLATALRAIARLGEAQRAAVEAGEPA
jgi:ribonuclease PH